MRNHALCLRWKASWRGVLHTGMGVVGRAWAVQRGCPGTGRSWSKNQLNLFHIDAESNDNGCAQEVEVTIFFGGNLWLERLGGRQRDCMQEIRKSAGVEA
jgi:hypothetical protein